MKNILFFITTIIFITGCGASFPALTSTEAQKGHVILVKNAHGTLFSFAKGRFIVEIEKTYGLSAKEFAYSSTVSCTSLGYTRFSAQDVKGDSDKPDIYAYANLSQKTCLEFDFSKTSLSGGSGFTFLLK